jgi:hypothetical protein
VGVYSTAESEENYEETDGGRVQVYDFLLVGMRRALVGECWLIIRIRLESICPIYLLTAQGV